jgi:uncharacterized glyoxalase superfamily protein PhnB
MAKDNLIGGVYEIGVGVADLDQAMTFWSAAGYRAGPTRTLPAARAFALYGVASDLTSRQLVHQQAAAGLVRLMQWDKPTGPGLNMAPLKTHGNRWSVHKTDDLLNAYVHGEVYRRQGFPIHLRAFQFNFNLGKQLADKRPFREVLSANTDVLLFQPEAQYILMTRINFDVGKYGTINPDSLLRASEGCHMALVIQGDDLSVFDFYADVVGFKRGKVVEIAYRPGYMPSDMLELEPDESFAEVDFNDPMAGEAPGEHLPGRLRCFLLRSPRQMDDRLERAQPGNLGYSMYTCRCGDIRAMHQRVASSSATGLTPIMADEFGTPAFAFTAPDGFRWLALAA